MVSNYLEWLEAQVEAQLYSKETLIQRRSKFGRLAKELCGDYFEKEMEIPQSKLIELRDKMSATPGAADNFIKAIRSMYTWACDRKICDVNPATGIAKINKGKGGATPWKLDDVKTFIARHPEGTEAHLCLMIFLFTLCRIEDAVILGREHEFMRDGIKGIGWQPAKKGSAFVAIPLVDKLFKATRHRKVQGKTYLLSEWGQPFKSKEGLRQKFRQWCNKVDLHHLSSHGIRKGGAQIIAELGHSQYQIMSIHGHTQAKISEIYTKDVERWKLAYSVPRPIPCGTHF